MDDCLEEDKAVVSRARKIQRFLSQPFQVAECKFHRSRWQVVSLPETIKGFKGVYPGRRAYDHLPEVFLHGLRNPLKKLWQRRTVAASQS
ncbi:UNVERIFIED_CONTAM: hypothetical protein GTU68_040889 [Idotea baltica]|nr:hypothetical protein [Idotea baltica]